MNLFSIADAKTRADFLCGALFTRAKILEIPENRARWGARVATGALRSGYSGARSYQIGLQAMIFGVTNG